MSSSASSHRTRAALRIALALGLVSSVSFAGPVASVGLPLASAQRPSYIPVQDATPSDWVNPDARSTDPATDVSLKVKDIAPRVVEFPDRDAEQSGATQAYTLQVNNNSDQPISDLNLALKSGPSLASSAEVRTSLLSNSGEYPQTSPATPIASSAAESTAESAAPESEAIDALHLDPGASTDVKVQVTFGAEGNSPSTAATEASTPQASISVPAVTAPGTYPVLFNLTGTQKQSQQQLAVTRATVTALASEKDRKSGNQRNSDESSPTPLTFLWPLGAETNAVPGATGNAPNRSPLYLSDDSLAGQLKEGGRLRNLLDTYRDAVNGPQGERIRTASCLAIDPDLLDVVEQMTHGYRVGSEPPRQVEENKRLRDSWGDLFRNRDKSVAGSGQQDAINWLNDLRSLVEGGCTVALPYGGADIDSLANTALGPAANLGGNATEETGDTQGTKGSDATDPAEPATAANPTTSSGWLGVHALGHGPAVINEVLGVWPTQNIVIPATGQIAEQSLPFLAAGATQGINNDFSRRFEAMVKGLPALPAKKHREDVTALVADNTVRIDQPATKQASDEDDSGDLEPGTQSGEIADDWNDRLVNLSVDDSGSDPTSQSPGGGFRALRFSGDLGTVLAATGSNPQTTPYSNPAFRYDLSQDSQATRMSNVLAVFQQELNHHNPILTSPPGEWTVNKADAQAYLQFIEDAFANGDATPASLGTAVSPQGIDVADLASGTTNLPFPDPADPPEDQAAQLSEVAHRELSLTLTMRNSTKIALNREQFTRPLFIDLVRATSAYRARNLGTSDNARDRSLNRIHTAFETTDTLLDSVALLPPGNVFTRTSDSSPLIVVAQNGLPLPVDAKIRYQDVSNPQSAIKESDPQTIPAKGSITVPLTTIDLDSRRSDLHLWLTTPSDKRISETVQVSIQDGPSVSKAGLLAMFGAVIIAAIGGKLLLDRRRKRLRLTRLRVPGGADGSGGSGKSGNSTEPEER